MGYGFVSWRVGDLAVFLYDYLSLAHGLKYPWHLGTLALLGKLGANAILGVSMAAAKAAAQARGHQFMWMQNLSWHRDEKHPKFSYNPPEGNI